MLNAKIGHSWRGYVGGHFVNFLCLLFSTFFIEWYLFEERLNENLFSN